MNISLHLTSNLLDFSASAMHDLCIRPLQRSPAGPYYQVIWVSAYGLALLWYGPCPVKPYGPFARMPSLCPLQPLPLPQKLLPSFPSLSECR